MKIFVFGSNLAGKHGKGAALEAREKYGAILGKGKGRQGNSYAIPTKDRKLRTLALDKIHYHVSQFIYYASKHPRLRFFVTPIGTGLAGYTSIDIAPMFKGTTPNVILPKKWRKLIVCPTCKRPYTV